MTYQGDQLAVATGLDPHDAEAVLGVLVRDALDQAGEHLAIRWPGLAVHDGHDCQPGKLRTACRISQPPKAHTGTRSTRRRPPTSTIVRAATAPNTRLMTSSSFVMGMPSQCGHSPLAFPRWHIGGNRGQGYVQILQSTANLENDVVQQHKSSREFEGV